MKDKSKKIKACPTDLVKFEMIVKASVRRDKRVLRRVQGFTRIAQKTILIFADKISIFFLFVLHSCIRGFLFIPLEGNSIHVAPNTGSASSSQDTSIIRRTRHS